MPWDWWWGWHWAMMGTMGLFWIVLIVALVLLIVWLVRQVSRPGGTPAADEPLAILKRRYARGELSREEFERMRQELA